MQYFEKFTSNTTAGSGNQFFFTMAQDEVRTGRVFYKISVPGAYAYSILFSNIIDSTYSDGLQCHKNWIVDDWTIHSAKIGKCAEIPVSKPLSELTMDDGGEADIVVSDLQEITFQGKPCKTVMPGEFFTSDPIGMDFQKDEYLCLELTFSGKTIPYHEESLLPIFVKKDGVWTYSRQMPVAGMVGCDRTVCARVGYAGDSITQGIGTEPNAYTHWNAVLSEKLGPRYAFWNLGIGFGRADDLASGGAWFYKVKQNDVVVVCYGVNDIYQGFSEEQIRANLTRIVDDLKKLDKTVILQTIPPFDYPEELVEVWRNLNRYIKEVLVDRVDLVFDNCPVLGLNEAQLHRAKYGGHPDAEGCARWAEALYEKLITLLK